MPDMTPDEIAFFATGELPASLQTQVDDDSAAQAAVAEAARIAQEAAAAKLVAPPATPTPPAIDNTVLQQALIAEQQRAAQAAAELALVRQQLEAKTNPPVPAPDPATDPLGAMMHQLNTVNATVQDLQQKLLQEQSNNQLKTQFNEFANSIRAIKDAFVKTTPDFNDAYQHIRNQRAADLRLTGVPEAQIPQVMLQDELNIAQNALQQGKNPAEEMYNMAKRYGYAPKAAPQNGQQKVEAILNGQAADKNPGGASPPAASITVESLKDMSSSDLNKVVMNDKQWEQLVGGKSHDIF